MQPNLFLVPFLNIPFGASSTSSYYGSNYATTPSYGTSTSLLGVNSGSIIYAVIIGLAAIILIPLFIYSFTGVSTSPYGRSKRCNRFHMRTILISLSIQFGPKFARWWHPKYFNKPGISSWWRSSKPVRYRCAQLFAKSCMLPNNIFDETNVRRNSGIIWKNYRRIGLVSP